MPKLKESLADKLVEAGPRNPNSVINNGNFNTALNPQQFEQQQHQQRASVLRLSLPRAAAACSLLSNSTTAIGSADNKDREKGKPGTFTSFSASNSTIRSVSSTSQELGVIIVSGANNRPCSPVISSTSSLSYSSSSSHFNGSDGASNSINNDSNNNNNKNIIRNNDASRERRHSEPPAPKSLEKGPIAGAGAAFRNNNKNGKNNNNNFQNHVVKP